MSHVVAVELALDTETVIRLERLDPGAHACRTAIADEIATATERLGLPVRAEVRVVGGAPARRPVRVRIGDLRCRTRPPELDRLRHLGRLGLPCYCPRPSSTDLLAERLERGDRAGTATLLASLATETVLDDAGKLARLVRADAPPATLAVLARAAELGFRVDDSALDGDHGLRGVEAALDAMAPDEWEIRIQPDYLETLTETMPDDPPLAPLPEALFTYTGVRSPGWVLVEDPALPEHGFAVAGGGRRTPPLIGLPPRSVLVPDASDAGEVLDPMTGGPARVVDAPGAAAQEAEQMTGPGDVLAVLVGHVVRSRAASLVTMRSTAVELELLEHLQPSLAAAATDRLPALTAARRALVEQDVNVRDMGELAQAVVDATVRTGEPSAHDRLDAQVDALVDAVRVTLAATVVAGALGDDAATPRHSVPADLLAAGPDDPDAVARVADHVDRAFADADAGAVFVVPGEFRARFSAVAAQARPRVRVLAAEELAAAR